MGILTTLEPHMAAIKIGIAVAGIVAIAAGSSWATHQIDEAAYAKLENKYKDAEIAAINAARAVQAAEDAVSLKAAVEEAKSQQNIVTQTEIVTKEVPKYVPVASKCAVTLGFLRVLDSAVLGVSPANLPLPAGQSDESCAVADPRTLALNIIANYGTCQANAEQLGALQAWVKNTIEASKPPPKK